jgi:thymidylate synthase (FAD)
MGDDLSIVNDARISYGKESNQLDEKDIKLINYLAKHNHTSPFRGVVFKFKVKAPLFVCRQWWKHVVASNHNDEQLGWNEKSLRYVDMTKNVEFYVPELFRKQSPTNKQAGVELINIEHMSTAYGLYDEQCKRCHEVYTYLLELGVCKEQARGVLPTSVYTSWVWTASLQAVLNFLILREGEGAQEEIRQYARVSTT